MLRAIWIVCLSLSQGIPSHAVILGVPFISWREAAHLDYPNKNILNPAVPAVLGMVFEYWGRDRHSLADSLAAPDDWNTNEGVGTLDSVRFYVAHGIPLFVRLEMTPFAHQAEPNVAALGTLSDSGNKVSPQQVTQAQFEHIQALLSDFAGFGSDVMGKMVSAETLRRWGGLVNSSTWQESVFLTPRVAIGYDDDRRVVILHDPSFGPAWEVGYDDFETMWKLFDHSFIAIYPVDSSAAHAHHSGSVGKPYASRSASQRAAESFVFGYALASVGRGADAKARLSAALAGTDVPAGYRHLFLLELGKVAEANAETPTA